MTHPEISRPDLRRATEIEFLIPSEMLKAACYLLVSLSSILEVRHSEHWPQGKSKIMTVERWGKQAGYVSVDI